MYTVHRRRQRKYKGILTPSGLRLTAFNEERNNRIIDLLTRRWRFSPTAPTTPDMENHQTLQHTFDTHQYPLMDCTVRHPLSLFIRNRTPTRFSSPAELAWTLFCIYSVALDGYSQTRIWLCQTPPISIAYGKGLFHGKAIQSGSEFFHHSGFYGV